MYRAIIIVVAVLSCLSLCQRQVMAQASEQMKKQMKESQSAQRNSWQQVDQINREADHTRARLQQARESGEQAKDRPAYTVKKTKVGTTGAYKKSGPSKPVIKKKNH